MSDGAIHLFAGIAVADYAAARDWYERVFGRGPDLVPHEREAAWQVVEGGWLYVVADAERAGRALVTVLVSDLDAQLAALAHRGITVGPIETLTRGPRRAAIVDPEGNRITLAQVD